MQISALPRFVKFPRVDLTSAKLIVTGLSVFLGVGMGFLIVTGDWFFAFILALLLPGALILINHPFVGVFLWLLVMPWINVLPNNSMIYWLIYRILIVLILCLMIIKHSLLNRGSTHIRLSAPDAAVIILVIYGTLLIVATQASSSDLLVRFVDRMLLPLALFLIVRLNPLEIFELKLLEWTACLIAISQGIVGIAGVITPGVLPASLRPYLQGYAAGTLDNPNVFAITLLLCGLLLYQSAMKREGGWVRLLFLLSCGLCVIGIVLCMERAAWLTLALVLVGLLGIYPRQTIPVFLAGGFLVFILFLAGYLMPYLGSASDRLYDDQPVYDRIVVTDAMVRMIMEKPLFGWGYETLNMNIAAYYRIVGNASIFGHFVTSHNTYLTILTEQGLITLLLYGFPFLFLAIKTAKNWKRIPNSGLWSRSMLFILWLSAGGHFLITNFLDMRWFPYGVGLWWITLGLIANIVTPIFNSSKSTFRSRNNRLVQDFD